MFSYLFKIFNIFLIYIFEYLDAVDPKKVAFVIKNTSPFSGNTRALADALLNRGARNLVVYKDGCLDEECLNWRQLGVRVYTEFSLLALRDVHTAGVIVLGHSGRDGFLRRRKKGRKIINLWHGVAIKRIEHLMRWRLGDFKRRYLMRRNSHLYHAMIASSPLDRLTNAVSFGVDLDKVYAIGLPRFDYLRSDFSFSWRLKKDIERLNLALSGRRLILFAPTFRERRGQAISFLNSETLEKLKIFLQKNNFVFGIRPHPYDQDGLDEICDDNWIVNISPDKFIEPAIALRAADILIADYSSIWIDFLLLDRPMIGVMPDYKNYADRERGFIFDIFDVFPGPIIFDWSLVFIYLEKIVNSYALFAAEYFGKYQRAKNLFLPSEGLVFHSTNACLELFFNND